MSSRLMLVPIVAGLFAGCSAVPNAVVAVPKNAAKPVFQIERLERARGSKLRWAFANDFANDTVLEFDFGSPGNNVFKPDFKFACVQVNAQTRKPAERTAKVRNAGNGPSFALPAATALGPSVCVASLEIRNDIATGEYAYTVKQDGVVKTDPVIIIR
jgi:hypothetical protein